MGSAASELAAAANLSTKSSLQGGELRFKFCQFPPAGACQFFLKAGKFALNLITNSIWK